MPAASPPLMRARLYRCVAQALRAITAALHRFASRQRARRAAHEG